MNMNSEKITLGEELKSIRKLLLEAQRRLVLAALSLTEPQATLSYQLSQATHPLSNAVFQTSEHSFTQADLNTSLT